MLLSMTGHGQSLVQNSQFRVLAEVRSVNHRFLKTNVHCDLSFEQQAKLESLIKQRVSRGNVTLKINVQILDSSQNYQINKAAIQAYWLQLSEIAGSSQHVNVESILHLPGIVQEQQVDYQAERLDPLLEQVVTESLELFNQMRALEGEAMASDMRQNCAEIQQQLDGIKVLAPTVIDRYSQRLTDRIQQLLKQHEIAVQTADVIKEIGVFADRVDISEEIVRLESHLQQFNAVMDAEISNGRKLDFLIQEMLRETNTIGSKANNAEIATGVVAIKTAIERIREMAQNVE